MTDVQEATIAGNEPRPLRPVDILNSMKDDAPVFVGFSERGPVGEPVEIKRWGQFIVKFGSMKKCGYLATSANGFFLNGGKRFYALNLGERPESLEDVKARFKEGLRALDVMEDIPFIVAPGEHDPAIHEAILEYCENRGIYALLDGPEELIERPTEPPEEESEVDVEAAEKPPGALVEDGGDEALEIGEDLSEPEEEEKYENMPSVTGDNGLVVYPWIYLRDRVMGDFYIPPSGHIAGILCRLFNSGERPEFSTIQGTVLLKYKFPPEEIEKYSPRGISFLRYPTKHPGLMLE